MTKVKLWDKVPGKCEEEPIIKYFKPEKQTTDTAVVVFPGGGYNHRAVHEGEGYGKFLSENGIPAFVVEYRVFPHVFPLPLLDARRAVRLVRYNADKFGIDKNKVCVMGSSAGAHLAALVSTYYEKIDFEGIDDIDNEDFLPNKQILCYPVISLFEDFAHKPSGDNFLGENSKYSREELSPNIIMNENVPDAFIWHTFSDGVVNVKNSLVYAEKIKDVGKNAEIHIFPEGNHGQGLGDYNKKYDETENNNRKYNSKWGKLLLEWFKFIGYMN